MRIGEARIGTSEEFTLSVATARLVDGDPVPIEHDAVRWLRAAQLDAVRWAEADLPFLDHVRRLLDEG